MLSVLLNLVSMLCRFTFYNSPFSARGRGGGVRSVLAILLNLVSMLCRFTFYNSPFGATLPSVPEGAVICASCDPVIEWGGGGF